MADGTAISWADATWNPLLGCSRVSPGCDGCYAVPQSRIRAANPHPKIAAAFAGLTVSTEDSLDWTGRVNELPERLQQPLKWHKPKRIFVNSLSDLFYEKVSASFIADVFAVMSLAEQHTFQVLTKRHGRMKSLLNNPDFRITVNLSRATIKPGSGEAIWPLPNLWLGVSVENQQWADIRIPALLDTPAAIRWISAEPLLGPVDLSAYLGDSRGCADAQGRSGVPGGRDGLDDGRFGRPHLACGCAAGEPLEQRDASPPLRPPTSGTRRSEVSAGPPDDRRESVSRDGTQTRLEAFLRPDSRGPDDQSQERPASGQQAGQLGVGNLQGASAACPRCAPSRASRPVRGTQSDGEADDGAGTGDLFSEGVGRAAAIDRGRLRSSNAADLEDCSGRAALSWIVTGGESGPRARPMHPDWVRSLRDQCTQAGTAFHMKQNGAYAPVADRPTRGDVWVRVDGSSVPWDRDDGHIRHGLGDFRLGDAVLVRKVGKTSAGRELDGRIWDEYPQPAEVAR